MLARQSKSWSALLIALASIVGSFGLAAPAEALPKSVGKGYCTLRHPVEALTSTRATCESQHVIQRRSGGTDDSNTIWLNTTLHSGLDRSTCKPWSEERPPFEVGDENLQRAYMMGTWANGFHFFLYDHHGTGDLTIEDWDASTHLLHAYAAIVNLPQKEIGYFAYQLQRLRAEPPQTTQFIDTVLGVLFDVIEVAAGTVYSIIAVVVGALFNPWDTLWNLIALVPLILATTLEAIYMLVVNAVALFTGGSMLSCQI
ncbi:hypothetical protein OMW55_06260 [Sphingomonas sp. BN140010]|uniref:Uncharacterized protein n=1 Tax=Sphingomonas arvum TaxID=2992113 RepID=A0ABT3JEA8_9SPHN|nr:hypothetical protein [Sphingomonas sp. BN140010]MCW3797407.1 hypothetical protein [Sphingomonas sp. BN140010]